MKALLLVAALSLNAFAATAPDKVDLIDAARAGNLRQLVIQEFVSKYKADCTENEVPKYEAIKLSGGSSKQTRNPGTPYNYEATYLIIQKCLWGSTYAGAYFDFAKSSMITGSFTSHEDHKGRVTKMENIQLKFLSDVTIDAPKN